MTEEEEIQEIQEILHRLHAPYGGCFSSIVAFHSRVVREALDVPVLLVGR